MGIEQRPIGIKRKIFGIASPTTPERALKKSMKAKQREIPKPLIKAINNLLNQETDSDGYCNVTQPAITKIVGMRRLHQVESAIDNRWANVSEVYRNKGWEVEYVPTGHPPYLKFQPSKKK